MSDYAFAFAWGVLLVGLVASAVAWLCARGGSRHQVPVEELERLYRPHIVPVPPLATDAPKPEPPKPSMVTLRLVSETGRLLKTVELPARQRRPVYRYAVNSTTIWLFNAESRDESGEWIYRRVGKERV